MPLVGRHKHRGADSNKTVINQKSHPDQPASVREITNQILNIYKEKITLNLRTGVEANFSFNGHLSICTLKIEIIALASLLNG